MENWRGTFSIPRVVSLNEKNEVCLYPVKELAALETETEEYQKFEAVPKRRYLHPADARSFSMELWLDVENVTSRYLEIGVLGAGERATVIEIDLVEKVISLDKSQGDLYGRGRMNCPVELENGKFKILILVDCSSVEIYINEGRYCITSNVYPEREQTECWISTPYKNAVIDKIRLASLGSIWDV